MRNISPSNRKPSAAGSGFRTEDLWVTCRPPYPLCHSGYPSGFQPDIVRNKNNGDARDEDRNHKMLPVSSCIVNIQ